MPPYKKVRECGTPGCTLPDHHDGMCNNEKLSKRPRFESKPPPPKLPQVQAVKRPRRPEPPKKDLPPAEQGELPSGIRRFYHVHRWGVPLPDGPVDYSVCSDEEVDSIWQLDEVEQRIRGRPDVPAPDADVAALWNRHIWDSPPIVTDRMLPHICRKFARANAAALGAELRQSFEAHLVNLFEHNLLHEEDVQDCMLIVAGDGGQRVCHSCDRALHDESCPRAGQARGATAWPLQQQMTPQAEAVGGPSYKPPIDGGLREDGYHWIGSAVS